MDINGCKPLFNHRVVAHTSFGRDFVGTLQPIEGSTATVKLVALPDDIAQQYQFAINGVSALDIGSVVFMQDLNQPH